MSTFKFKYFSVQQSKEIHRVGTDAMVLGALVSEEIQPRSILDIGTGSGVLALMVAQRFSHSQVFGVEKNPIACDLAKLNFESCSFQNQPELIASSFQEYVQSTGNKFDLIISNPPFFKSSTPAKGDERNMARHQNSLTIEDLLNGVEQILSPEGSFWVILPQDQAQLLLGLNSHLKLHKRIQIYGKPGNHVRDVLRLSFLEIEESVAEQLVIRDENGEYSAVYKTMTRDFHGVSL